MTYVLALLVTWSTSTIYITSTNTMPATVLNTNPVSSTISIKDLKEYLTTLCVDYDLSYNTRYAPIKVGPDVYMFTATSLTDDCRKRGYCKQSKFYALTGGERVDILDDDMNTLTRRSQT